MGFSEAGLISRYSSIHLDRPGVNSTHQIFYIRESLLKQEIRRVGASHTMVADGNNLCIGA